MQPDRYPPDDPRAWLARAHSDLSMARTRVHGAYLEDHCYHAQQAAEKAFKALLLHKVGHFPYIHNLLELLSQIKKARYDIPPHVQEAVILSDYGVEARYPGTGESVTEEEWQEALRLAEGAVRWVESIIL